ncbi:hypothetical protein Salat_2601500 [Sesamum alatum]|uniref:Uncharacterized protein n=1 Tax=Sesamum alatum TaxID=300844 RepID=A0AAE1XN57_9LAMI|nr:hypothetical protein Salat_2601500 [Sesamum alatum]
MMCSNSMLSSLGSEKRWVIEMCKTFPQDHVMDIDFDTPPCVCRVPESFTQANPQAYAPQRVGMGPYHHFRPDLYAMQRKKLAAVTKFLNAEQLQNFQLVVEVLMQREPLLRACYDQYLDLDPMTLAWIVAIDAVYLLQFMKNYPGKTSGEDGASATQKPGMESLVGDILMLENQIPLVLLKEVGRVLQISPCDGDNNALFEEYRAFCCKVSPLEVNEQKWLLVDMGRGHLLHVLYVLIINNSKDQEFEFCKKLMSESVVVDNLKTCVDIAVAGGLPGAAIAQQHLSFLGKVPWERILSLFKTGDPDEQNHLVEEIDIPSVSQLKEIADVTFELTPGGIRDVKYDEAAKKFYLPVINLNSNSEVILRNLVAYEAAISTPGSTLKFAEYVDLMCGIIDTPKDVEILRKAEIIKSDLSDTETACIFNGMRKTTGKNENGSTNIEKAIDTVNEQFDNITRVKVCRFIKKHVYTSWKFLTFLSTVLVLMLLTLQAFCEVYGCGRRWFK